MKPPLRTDVIKAQVAGLLTAYPELREDDEALVLSLESETDAFALCENLVRACKESEARSNAVAAYISELRGRQDALDRRADSLRAALLTIMETAGLKSLPLTAATLSVRYSAHVNVVDRDLVPEQFRRQPPWEPMKQLISAALKSGQDVPGCTLSNSEPSLTIRVK
jgi:hypothetical protein